MYFLLNNMELNSIKTMESNKKVSWSVSKTDKDGNTTSMEVKEVENGYICCKRKSGYKKNDKGENEWYSENEEYISKTNPLEKKEEEKPKSNELMEAIKQFSEPLGLL